MPIRPALFTAFPAAQKAFFKKHGYVVIKRSASTKLKLLEDLNCEVISYAQKSRESYFYKIWRVFNSVSTADNRHSIGLPLTALTRQVLDASIGSVRHFLDGQLKADSPLVELSSIISYPGAKQQDVHSDSAWALDRPLLLSAFVALTRVHMTNGPTCLLEGSHTETAHMKHVVSTAPTYYSSDGEEIIVQHEDRRVCVLQDHYPPTHAFLDVGDMVFFDTNIFHYGSANMSSDCRALLCFAFQARDAEGAAAKVEGFTYHTHASMRQSALSLQSFAPN